MDLATLAGLLIALAAVVVSVLMDGASLLSLWNPSAFILIVGGTVGATVVGYRKGDLSRVPKLITSAFLNHVREPRDLIDRLVRMAEKARREGLLALQDDVATLDNPLLIRGVQMIVDGTDPDIVKNTMETQVEVTEHRDKNAAGILEAAGGFAPTIGIIGTVMGLVHVLENLGGDPGALGHAISVAFLATFYGIATANLFWLPLGSKVKQNIEYETLIGKMCIAGVVGLQTGEAPRALREKLEVYVSSAPTPRTNRRGGDDE